MSTYPRPDWTRVLASRISTFVDRRAAYVLILPTLLGVALVNLYPLAYALWISLEHDTLSTPVPTFIGFGNYRRIISDPEVWDAIRISIIFTAISVALSFAIGLLLASLLNRRLRGRSIMRSLFIIPWAVPAFVAALIWSWMYNDQFGIFSAILRQLGGHDLPVWLDRQHALGALILVMVWKSFPFQMVVLLAGLQSIPDDLYQAATVDGARPWQRFRSITLPLLRPVAFISVLLAAINAFHYFPIPWILTRGGPSNATNVIPIATYNIAFQSGDLGYGAAAAVLMFFFIMTGAGVYIWYYVKEVRDL